MTSTFPVCGPGCVLDGGAEDVCASVVELTGGFEEAFGDARWIERVQGLPMTGVRFTVIGMAGLWYLRRGMAMRQNFLKKLSVKRK